MYYRDPRCVFVADSIGLAHTVATWLTGEGIAAEVMDELTLGGFEGLTAWLPGKVSLRGIEIWVTSVDDAERARKLVEKNEATLRKNRTERAQRHGEVTAICEECGKAAMFAAAEQGTVQDCPHCGAFIDVPDPDDEPIIADDDADESSDPD